MMSTSTPSSTLTSETSSCTNSTTCVHDTECPTDSLHSLIDDGSQKISVTDCTGNECSMSCTDNKTNGQKKRKSIYFNTIGRMVWAIILIIISISGFIFPPLDVMLWEKLNMRPGFPPFEWWADPPDEVKMRAHIFNITNHERFMNGLDAKMNVQEIGPIVYLEKLKHSNMKFNENSTLTYTAERYLIYLPDENTIDLNDTVIVPNLALLGISSYLHDANYFVRTGFKLLVNTHGSELFLKRTIYEYLWDYRDALLETSRNLAPALVPSTNMGMLSKIYADFTDEVTVKIGPQWGHENFFQIDKLRGLPHITGYDPNKCPDTLSGSTEGVLYHQHLSKDEALICLRKTVCKVMPLYFEKEAIMDGVKVYRYNLPENVFDRVNGTDCYASDVPLPDGVSDASKCFSDFPMVASYPHFYTGSPPKDLYVTGLKPDPAKHNSYVYVEPVTGIPFRAVARMQCNLRINNLSSFYSPELDKFSNIVLPIGWIEYNQEGLPTYVLYMVYFMLVILPPLSTVIFIMTFILGTYLIAKQIYRRRVKRESLSSIFQYNKSIIDNLENNKMLTYEKETFLSRATKS
nr:scavenger receptor class B member 1-like [Vanessa tameamea]